MCKCALHNSWHKIQIGHPLNELPWWFGSVESACNAGDAGDHGFNFRIRKKTWKRAWQASPVFLPGESHGQRTLVGYNPWGLRVGQDWSDWVCTRTLLEWNSSSCVWITSLDSCLCKWQCNINTSCLISADI